MKKGILITIIILSVLSVCCGGYVVYDLVFSKVDNKCDAPLEEIDTENDENETDNEINIENNINNENSNEEINDNSSDSENNDISQNIGNDNENQDVLNVSKVSEKYFDIDNISKIEFGRYAMGPIKYETKVIEDKEIIKSIISEFSFLSFKEFVPYGIGFEGFNIRIIYNDGSVVSIWEVASENSVAILDKREKDYENNSLTNAIVVEFHNGLTFVETFNKYYQ